MKIAVLGTGMVGDAIASKLIQLGHEVMMGSRTANNEKAWAWVSQSGPKASQGTFNDAAKFGDIVFNCTNGMGTMEALRQATAEHLNGKILIDISNPLDFSKGMPPSLFVCNTDSLAEQIQREFPETKVVKTLNTINCNVMVNPSLVPGEHDVFVSGNDADAKTKVKEILKSFGWENIVDLGDITTARAAEMWVFIWVRLWGFVGHPNFNLHIAKA
ncbi:MAG: NAD(P)-binding domain-containing protein [Chitinophagales bacterium]|nr:NAD(P)-binding domain-containing protein [Chitinophagales bacterium]